MSKFKKLTAIVLSVLMLISAVPVVSSAAEIIDSGKCGDNLTWTLDGDGTLTISGEGEMYNFVSFGFNQQAPWSRADVKAVVVENGVTSIGNLAFAWCGYLTSVTIPESVTSIGNGAFSVCDSLTDIYYTGTEEEWSSISINNFAHANDYLINAAVHCNSVILPQYTPGDINGDRKINAKDSNLLKQILLGNITVKGKAVTAADVNGDGYINTKDSFMLKKMLLQEAD